MKLICTGHIPKALLVEARRRGDASFDTAFNFERHESALPPLSDNLHYAKPTGILLKLKNVDPHTDAQQMLLGPDETHAGSVFGLLSGRAILSVGDKFLRLKAGDWVHFDDQILHCVLADRKWVGVAIQCYTPDHTTDTEDRISAILAGSRQARGEPVAEVTVNKDRSQTWIALKTQWLPEGKHLLYTAPQPQQQAGEPFKSRRIDDVVRGLQASVAVGSDGEWVSIRREARDAAINRLQELRSDCAHMYESYVELASRSAPQPQQIPEGYRLCLIPKAGTDAFNAACSIANQESMSGTGPCGVFIAGLRAMLEAAPEVKP